MTGQTVLVDLRGSQFDGDRGIPAYAQSLAVELVGGDTGCRWLLLHDPRWPLPARHAELATHAEWCTATDLDGPRPARIDVLLTGCFFLPHHGCDGDYLYPAWLRRQQPRRLGIVYDLVPLLFPDRYLARDRARQQYHDALRVLRQSDHLFAISQATRRDTIRHAAVDPLRVSCIYGDIDHAKRALMAEPATATADVPARHGLTGPYVACVGGGDWRKNMDVAVAAFARFHRDHPGRRLAIICKLQPERIAELRRTAAAAGLPPEAVVCTGYVSDADLVALIRHAEMLIYPSLYEGLGLPVLEAYGCGTPVVGSNTWRARQSASGRWPSAAGCWPTSSAGAGPPSGCSGRCRRPGARRGGSSRPHRAPRGGRTWPSSRRYRRPARESPPIRCGISRTSVGKPASTTPIPERISHRRPTSWRATASGRRKSFPPRPCEAGMTRRSSCSATHRTMSGYSRR